MLFGFLSLPSVIPGEELGVMVPRRRGRAARPHPPGAQCQNNEGHAHAINGENPELHLIIKH